MRFVAVQLDEEIDKGSGGVLLLFVLQLESCLGKEAPKKRQVNLTSRKRNPLGSS